jgi:hypothetical protein
MMRNRLNYIALWSLCLIAGCATPVSKLGDEEFVWTNAYVPMNYQQTYRNLKQGLDACGSAFAVESNLYTDINEGMMVLYLKNLLGGNNGFVYGTIKLKKENEGTQVRIGVQTVYAKPLFGTSKAGETMLKFANGTYECE